MLEENGIIKIANVGDCGLRVLREGNCCHYVLISQDQILNDFSINGTANLRIFFLEFFALITMVIYTLWDLTVLGIGFGREKNMS